MKDYIEKDNGLFNNSSVILISGLSSSGKSSIANIICELNPAFVKLNTKSMNLSSEREFSRLYFHVQLQQAAKIINKPVESINSIFQEAKKVNSNSLDYLCNSILMEQKQIEPDAYIEILYQNYLNAVKNILDSGRKCIIDHNIFFDPYPSRKDIFLKYFKFLGDTFKTVNIYSNFRNIVLNTLERNKRFYSFLSNDNSIEQSNGILIEPDIEKGYSYYIFRQPLRVMENLALLYDINHDPSGKILQSITTQDFWKILNIIKYEQEKLIGFLVFKNYVFSHIKDEELLEFRSDFFYLNDISNSEKLIHIKEKRFFYDLQIITDSNLSIDDCQKVVNKGDFVDFRNEINNSWLANKIENLSSRIKKNQKFYLQNFDTVFVDGRNAEVFYVIDSFVQNDLAIIDSIVHDILTREGIRLVIYPIAENTFVKMLIDNQNNNFIEMTLLFFEGARQISCGFEEFDNNLVFLARLYSGLKIGGKKIKFNFIT